MGRRSWLHLIKCKKDSEKIFQFVENTDIIFIMGAALIHGLVRCFEYVVEFFGEEGKLSLVLLTQSDGSSIIEEMVKKEIINGYGVLLLDNIDDSELEQSKRGTKIKKATYLTEEEYFHHLNRLETSEEYNNLAYSIDI